MSIRFGRRTKIAFRRLTSLEASELRAFNLKTSADNSSDQMLVFGEALQGLLDDGLAGAGNPEHQAEPALLAMVRKGYPELELVGGVFTHEYYAVVARQGESDLLGAVNVALDGQARNLIMPHSSLAGDANLLVLPNIDAANISYNLLKMAAGGNIAIGPVLLGAAKPVHILTASTTVRRIVNLTALTVAGLRRRTLT